MDPTKNYKPFHLLTFSEFLVLDCNLLVARHLRICSKEAINPKYKISLKKRAIILEKEYKALKKKYKNYTCSYSAGTLSL